jgi:anti-sigma factor RsiW
MNHPKEEELIAYHDGEAAVRQNLGAHVEDCPECRAELERIDAVLAALNSIPVPEPGEDYGRRVWQQISPRLPEKRAHWWDFLRVDAANRWFAPQRWVAAGAIAALVLAAFIAGRISRPSSHATPAVADNTQVRERVLVMAVGEHLGRSEMILVELANAAPATAGQKQVSIAGEQRRAEDLLEENRLYRQTALEQGDAALAGVLDELERVLLDVAHSPQEVSNAQLETIRQRIESRGILFKVRVVGKELQQRGQTGMAPDAPGSGKGEGKKI